MARTQAPPIQRTFRIFPALKPHCPDLGLGLIEIADPTILRPLAQRVRRLIDAGHDAPKAKLRLAPELDSKLQELANDLGTTLDPPLSLYELVNASLMAARLNGLAPTSGQKAKLPDE